MRAIWLWSGALAVPLLAVVELVSHLWIGLRAPHANEWKAAAVTLGTVKRARDGLVVAPAWAEPIARQVLGDSAWRVSDLTRPDDVGLERVVEISMLGSRAPDVADWALVSEREQGPFQLRVLENPHYRRTLFSAVDAVAQNQAHVFVQNGTERSLCPRERRTARTGGLHGQVAFPAERYVCGQLVEQFVGVTIIDDQDFRPRRCIWAEPPPHGSLWISFGNVEFGKLVSGHMGSSYFLMREDKQAPVDLAVFIDGKRLLGVEYRDHEGWAQFSTATDGYAGRRGELSFEIKSPALDARQFCFSALTR